MSIDPGTAVFRFAIGEEVVMDTRDVAAYDVECGHPATNCRPWTIAMITGRSVRDGRPAYAVRFRHHGNTCVAIVTEDAIEGVA